MRKREAHWNSILNRYFRDSDFHCYYELKQVKGDKFYLSSIRDVQWDGLEATSKKGLTWKFSDEVSRPKPCDGANLPPLPSYLIVKFDDGFYFIPIELLIKIRDSGKKSITKIVAEKISNKIIKY